MNAGDITVTSALYAKVSIPGEVIRNDVSPQEWARCYAADEWGINADAIEVVRFTNDTNDDSVVTVKFDPEQNQNG